MPTKNKAILALIIANGIWGAASPIFKWSLKNITPFTLAFLRFALASLLMLPFVYKDLWISKKDILKVAAIGIFGVGLNIPFFFFGLTLAPSINAPMIASSGPIFIILLSMLILNEKPKRKVIWGTLLSLVGVLVIVIRSFLESGVDGNSILGNIFFLIATWGAVIHAIISKSILKIYKAGAIAFWSFVVGSLIFLPFFILENQQYLFLTNLDSRGIMGIVFGVVFSSAVAYFLYQWGIQKLAVNEVGIFTYIDPVMAILIAVPLLKESITLPFVLGSILVFTGIYIAEGRINYHFFADFLNLTSKKNKLL